MGDNLVQVWVLERYLKRDLVMFGLMTGLVGFGDFWVWNDGFGDGV